ncbi:MAG: hypothetical protein A4E53_03076 [Pelotomaculum sp. PtaB.Bin104]|nr:MAG: hypothetical protein A4E53_03076 [Pelotomaculum sp. PtaB.Bin104]
METTNTSNQMSNTTVNPAEYLNLEEKQDIRLTSAELANLWSGFMSSSLKECVAKYLLAQVQDEEISGVLEYALHIARQHGQTISAIYQKEQHPLPRGFTDEDVNINAPRLFTDQFILSYMEFMAEIRINGYATALTMTARTDIRKYFTECLASAAELYNKTASVILAKGLYLRAPQIPIPDRVDFAKKRSFMTGFLGERRPLTSLEISHIFSRAKTNFLRKALFTGFAQVAKSEQVRDYMFRGRDIAIKQIEVLSSLLIKNGLPMPATWDSGVLQSTEAPFSDKLKLHNVRIFNAMEIGNLGKAISVGIRHDVAVTFTRLTAEVAKYSEDGVNILIDNAWLEEPPQAADPDALKRKMH